MKFALVADGVWSFGSYRILRTGAVDKLFHAMFHANVVFSGSKEECVKFVMRHRRREVCAAFERAWADDRRTRLVCTDAHRQTDAAQMGISGA